MTDTTSRDALREAAQEVVIQEGRYYERDGSGESNMLSVVPQAALSALRAALATEPPALDVDVLARAFAAGGLEGVPYRREQSVPDDYKLHCREVAKLLAREYRAILAEEVPG